MAALTQPTGAQIIAFLPQESGESVTIGTMSAATIDALIASDTLANPVTKAYLHIRSVVTDPDNLSAEAYPFAKRALMWATLYELFDWDRMGRMAIPNADGGGLQIQAYDAKMWACAENVGRELRELGITTSNYWTYPEYSAEKIGGVNEILRSNTGYNYGDYC